MTVAAQVLAASVRAYQLTLRPIIGGHCRFEPSCSHYAIEALRTHGAGRGSLMTVRRILRCNPWCDGGYDPIPVALPGEIASRVDHTHIWTAP